METLTPVELPPGNEIKDFFPIIRTDKEKTASSFAHRACHEYKRTTCWQPIKDAGGRFAGYAVYMLDLDKQDNAHVIVAQPVVEEKIEPTIDDATYDAHHEAQLAQMCYEGGIA